MEKLTKSENKILAKVEVGKSKGALIGLGISPESPHFSDPEYRFIKRLYEAKKIVWVAWTKDHGSGWALPDWSPVVSEYYVEFDEGDEMYYVYHTGTGDHTYSSWCDKGQAQEDADRRNGVEKL